MKDITDLIKSIGFQSGMEKTAATMGSYSAVLERAEKARRQKLLAAALMTTAVGAGVGGVAAYRHAKKKKNAA